MCVYKNILVVYVRLLHAGDYFRFACACLLNSYNACGHKYVRGCVWDIFM